MDDIATLFAGGPLAAPQVVLRSRGWSVDGRRRDGSVILKGPDATPSKLVDDGVAALLEAACDDSAVVATDGGWTCAGILAAVLDGVLALCDGDRTLTGIASANALLPQLAKSVDGTAIEQQSTAALN